MVVFRKASGKSDQKLPNIVEYQSKVSYLADAFTLQEYDANKYPDIMRYLITMHYKHDLLPIGAINIDDLGSKVKFLYYKEPTGSKMRSISQSAEVVSNSSIALEMGYDCARKDIETSLNQV